MAGVYLWQLASNGYLDVDGKYFSDLEQCRQYSRERIIRLHQEHEDVKWYCHQVEEPKTKHPIELPPVYKKP
jgi:hypothetical protein